MEFSLDFLEPNDVVASLAEHRGDTAIRLALTLEAETPDNPTFAQIADLEFHNGPIKIEVAGGPLPDATPKARGFIGIAFLI